MVRYVVQIFWLFLSSEEHKATFRKLVSTSAKCKKIMQKDLCFGPPVRPRHRRDPSHWARLDGRPDDGSIKHLWNVGKLLPVYTAQKSRWQSYSYSLPPEPKISPITEQFEKSIRWKRLMPAVNVTGHQVYWNEGGWSLWVENKGITECQR
jgi:hypothetical protein